MNQDFALNITPAVARRLLRLRAANEQIKLPLEFMDIAKSGCIGRYDFDEWVCPYTPERAAMVQFLLDCQLRAIVQAAFHPVMNEMTILRMISLSGVQPITIIGFRHVPWRTAARAHFLDITIVAPQDLRGSDIDQRRRGVLIIDMKGLSIGSVARFFREFPRIILYNDAVSKEDMIHWTALAAGLFPTMPSPSAVHMITGPAHYAKMPLLDFALYYNTCIFPEYIKSKDLLELANNAAHVSRTVETEIF